MAKKQLITHKKTYSVILTNDDFKKFRKIRHHYEKSRVTPSDILRRLIMQEYDELREKGCIEDFNVLD